MLKRSIIFFTILIGHSLMAQVSERIRPGIMYNEGTNLESPKYGFTATIPDNWTGMLPQGTEIFMLHRTDGTSGEVLMFARPEGDLDLITDNWKNGAALTDAIYLKAEETDIVREGDMAYSPVTGEGERINPQYKGFIFARCGEYGPCVTLLMITPEQFFDDVRAEMMEFMKRASFTEPSNRNPYENFNWQEFLSGKVMVTYEMDQGAKRQNMINLCADGTFQTNIRQSGWLKQDNKAYMGKKTGRWNVEGNGPETVLNLVFDKEKAPPIDMVVSIQDEKIFVRGVRYYAGYSDYCN